MQNGFRLQLMNTMEGAGSIHLMFFEEDIHLMLLMLVDKTPTRLSRQIENDLLNQAKKYFVVPNKALRLHLAIFGDVESSSISLIHL